MDLFSAFAWAFAWLLVPDGAFLCLQKLGAEIFGTKFGQKIHFPKWSSVLPNLSAENFGTKICGTLSSMKNRRPV
ncbi:hypothetical protein ACX3T8_08125 [Corynebacterium pyruviciproducens]|uniref:hypothetical protein n=1 Tax=Corynebacterium pyruviciproducens TaxID=598660 RepID=UPI0023F53352|nr:hypothetical protein [Corynebacterium pyruviciproducens]MDK6564975.1 hypothetical protein [Corynebacterium pyruviciproducens]